MLIMLICTLTEKKIKAATPVKEYMTKEKRRQLRMPTKDAINLHRLHREVNFLINI